MSNDCLKALAGFRWHRLSVTLINIRSIPATSAHPLSVFQAIIKGVSLGLLPLAPEIPPLSISASDSIPDNNPQTSSLNENIQIEGEKYDLPLNQHSGEHDSEPLVAFHIRQKKHSYRMHGQDRIPLEIYFFRRGREYINRWRDALTSYLSDPQTGKNFDIVGMGDIEERSLELIAAERGTQDPEGEICLEFLTPFPFKAEKGKSRTYISTSAFIRSFGRRFSRLFGKEVVYKSQDDQFSIFPCYWNYTEIRHASQSQAGHTQYINGCVGKLYLKGHFKDFLPFLLMGSELHTGTKISNAQGYYLLHKDSPGYFTGYFPNKRAIVSVIRDVINRYDNALQILSEEQYPFDEDVYAEKILRQISDNTYIPSPNTAFPVRKKGGVDRLVEQVQFRDLIVQQYLLKTISVVFDRFFEEESIGFRKGVSRQKSIEIIQAAIAEGYRYVVESDIEDFFPSVDLNILVRLLDYSMPQADICLKNILLKSIKNGYILKGVYYERTRGLAQGSPLSPILTNLYLDSFDEMIKQWGGANQNNVKGVKMVRYADDFIILTQTEEDARKILSETESHFTTLGLKIKKEKTAIKPIEDGFQFLGMRFFQSAATVDNEGEFKAMKKPLYITEPYLFLSLNGDAVDICKGKEIIETIPLRRISEIMIMEKAVFSTALLKKCTENNIPLTITLGTGYYITTVKPDSKKYYDISYEHGRRYYTLSETERLCIAKEFAAGKIQNYISLFRQKYIKGQYLFIEELEDTIRQIYQTGDVQQVRGYEGALTKKIYQKLNDLIDHEVFHIRKRDRGNPDRINSLLNLGYYLLFSRINAMVRAIGLNPYMGFLHSPEDNYESLVCDIEELFRSRIDRFIIRLINLGVVAKEDFIETEKGLYLNKDTIKKFIHQFEGELDRKISPATLSVKEDMYIQVVILKKWALENGSLSFYRWNG